MRKIDLFILLALVAASAIFLRPAPGPKPSSPSPSPIASASLAPSSKMLTPSGRYEILPGRYEVAGLSLGMTKAQARERLGNPHELTDDNKETSQWAYLRDGDAQLRLIWLEGRLTRADATGRWSFSEGGRPLPCFGASQLEVIARMGEPSSKAEDSLVYQTKPGDITFRFLNGRVCEVAMTGEIKPQPLAP